MCFFFFLGKVDIFKLPLYLILYNLTTFQKILEPSVRVFLINLRLDLRVETMHALVSLVAPFVGLNLKT